MFSITYGHQNPVMLTNEDFIELGVDNGGLEQLRSVLSGLSGVRRLKEQEGHIQLYFENGGISLAEINRYCFGQGVVLNHLQLRKKSLESKFMELTKK